MERLIQIGLDDLAGDMTMNKILMLAVVATTFSGSTFAADLASVKSAPGPIPQPLWSGFYAGLNTGGTWGAGGSVNYSGVPTYVLPITISGMTAANYKGLA